MTTDSAYPAPDVAAAAAAEGADAFASQDTPSTVARPADGGGAQAKNSEAIAEGRKKERRRARKVARADADVAMQLMHTVGLRSRELVEKGVCEGAKGHRRSADGECVVDLRVSDECVVDLRVSDDRARGDVMMGRAAEG